MALVEEKKIGACTVRIFDDFCKNTTQEEIDTILKRIGELSYQAEVCRQLAERQKKKTS